jgi:hypothetical protein
VPGRTNDFQELITLLVQTLGEDRATPSAMVRSKVPGVRKREIDIRVEAEVDGLPVYIGIEASASKSRRKSVEWVERMNGKHDHLATSKLVLVSSSGFTKGALALAEYYGIKAITPGDVTPGFVGEIVNNLTSLWLETLNFKADETTIQFDPPIDSPEGPLSQLTLPPPAWSAALYRPDSAELGTVGQMIDAALHNLDLSEQNPSAGKANRFTITKDDPPQTAEGEPVFLHGGNGVEPNSLRRITRIEIVGKVDVNGVEMPLKHGHLDGVNYSNATAVLDDLKFHWAVVEGDDGQRIGTRVAPVDDPMNAHSYRSEGGTRMTRVPEGSSDK